MQLFELICGLERRSYCFLHRLCSRTEDDQPEGFSAFDWETVLHCRAGILGDYKELAILPDKIARYLYEFHAESYASHAFLLFQ